MAANFKDGAFVLVLFLSKLPHNNKQVGKRLSTSTELSVMVRVALSCLMISANLEARSSSSPVLLLQFFVFLVVCSLQSVGGFKMLCRMNRRSAPGELSS